jgi:hypothetical protein
MSTALDIDERCRISDCLRPRRARGWCVLRQRLPEKRRVVLVDDSTARIPLTRGFVAIIDAQDRDRVTAHSWSVSTRQGTHYAKTDIAGRRIYLHRFVLNAWPGAEVDHKNGDGLDCRRANLRFATRSQNNANRHRLRPKKSSRYRGVYYSTRGRWVGQVKTQSGILTARFATEDEAAAWYNKVARLHFGEFARLNALPSDVRAEAALP